MKSKSDKSLCKLTKELYVITLKETNTYTYTSKI